MNNDERWFACPPYSWTVKEKEPLFLEKINQLTAWHQARCPAYARILNMLSPDCGAAAPDLGQVPFLPVGLFKRTLLASCRQEETVRILTSSGTTEAARSQIVLDAETALLQQRALAHIVGDLWGQERIPMLILDSRSVMKEKKQFTARAAAIAGFAVFSSKRVFALDEEMRLQIDVVREFLAETAGKPFFLFGFTFVVWQHVVCALRKAGITLDCSRGALLHGGGWKKLQDRAVCREDFHAALRETCGLVRIHDYYGMAEQTGSVFMECEKGHLHCSNFSQVLIRQPEGLSLCGKGQPGIVQVLSTLPRSYPGHSILTEDAGVWLGEDDCACGRKGRYFKILGRLSAAEARGCSDVY